MHRLLTALLVLGVTGQPAEKLNPKGETAAIQAASQAPQSISTAAVQVATVSATAAPAASALATAAGTGKATAVPTDKAPHLMSVAKEQRLRKLLPHVDDPNLQKILQDPRLILYTEAEMPRAYQEWSGSLQGVHSAYYNISANGS